MRTFLRHISGVRHFAGLHFLREIHAVSKGAEQQILKGAPALKTIDFGHLVPLCSGVKNAVSGAKNPKEMLKIRERNMQEKMQKIRRK